MAAGRVFGTGDLEPGFIDAPGVAQTITVHGTGANAILLEGGTGQATIFGYFRTGASASQTIVAGLAGESGSISLLGGTSERGPRGYHGPDRHADHPHHRSIDAHRRRDAFGARHHRLRRARLLAGVRERAGEGRAADHRGGFDPAARRRVGQREPRLHPQQCGAGHHHPRRGRGADPGRRGARQRQRVLRFRDHRELRRRADPKVPYAGRAAHDRRGRQGHAPLRRPLQRRDRRRRTADPRRSGHLHRGWHGRQRRRQPRPLPAHQQLRVYRQRERGAGRQRHLDRLARRRSGR